MSGVVIIAWSGIRAKNGRGSTRGSQEKHLAPARPLHGVDPATISMVEAAIASICEWPHGMMVIRDFACSCKERSIRLLAYVMVTQISGRGIPSRPRVKWIVFLVGFKIERRFGWFRCVVPRDKIPNRRVMTTSAAALNAVHQKPRLLFHKTGILRSFDHRSAPRSGEPWRPVSSQNPEDIALIAQIGTEVASILFGNR